MVSEEEIRFSRPRFVTCHNLLLAYKNKETCIITIICLKITKIFGYFINIGLRPLLSREQACLRGPRDWGPTRGTRGRFESARDLASAGDRYLPAGGSVKIDDGHQKVRDRSITGRCSNSDRTVDRDWLGQSIAQQCEIDVARPVDRDNPIQTTLLPVKCFSSHF